MARGTFLRRVKTLIAEVYLSNLHLKVKEVRAIVIKRLHDPNDPYFDPYCEDDWPSESAVREVIRKDVRPRLDERPVEVKNLDEPWSMLALTNYDIAPEALPTVFELWAYALREYKKPLTIREMRWAARLYRIQNDLEELLLLASKYAAYEKVNEVLGDKIASTAKEVGFIEDTELYADTHMPKLTAEEIVKVSEDPEILKKKRQNLLEELRDPEILRLLGLESLIPKPKK